VAAGALTALIAWFLVGSVMASLIVGAIAAVIVLISNGFTSAGPPGRRGSPGGWSGGSGGSWSSGGSSSSGGFSGGGGSFGGGGASGSW
jgi:uncharacterized protein